MSTQKIPEMQFTNGPLNKTIHTKVLEALFSDLLCQPETVELTFEYSLDNTLSNIFVEAKEKSHISSIWDIEKLSLLTLMQDSNVEHIVLEDKLVEAYNAHLNKNPEPYMPKILKISKKEQNLEDDVERTASFKEEALTDDYLKEIRLNSSLNGLLLGHLKAINLYTQNAVYSNLNYLFSADFKKITRVGMKPSEFKALFLCGMVAMDAINRPPVYEADQQKTTWVGWLLSFFDTTTPYEKNTYEKNNQFATKRGERNCEWNANVAKFSMFSSTANKLISSTQNEEIGKAFQSKSKESGKLVVINFKVIPGKDIGQISYFPHEKEVLSAVSEIYYQKKTETKEEITMEGLVLRTPDRCPSNNGL